MTLAQYLDIIEPVRHVQSCIATIILGSKRCSLIATRQIVKQLVSVGFVPAS